LYFEGIAQVVFGPRDSMIHFSSQKGGNESANPTCPPSSQAMRPKEREKKN